MDGLQAVSVMYVIADVIHITYSNGRMILVCISKKVTCTGPIKKSAPSTIHRNESGRKQSGTLLSLGGKYVTLFIEVYKSSNMIRIRRAVVTPMVMVLLACSINCCEYSEKSSRSSSTNSSNPSRPFSSFLFSTIPTL